MSWEKSSYTAAGAALLSESLSGGALVITRAVSGTGTADADLSGETGVSGETHDLKLLDIETVESGGETARRVKIQITGADETYIMHQVGVSPGKISAYFSVLKYRLSAVLTCVPSGIPVALVLGADSVNRITAVAFPASRRSTPTSGARLSKFGPVLVGSSSAFRHAVLYSML